MFFFVTFIVMMVIRTVQPEASALYILFTDFYISGTTSFGGGAMLIPLLQESIVASGSLSHRDFVIGVAVIQAFPGPHTNLAVYIGGLASISWGHPAHAVPGAVLGFIGVFAPALIVGHGTIGIWSSIRGSWIVKSALRGIHAAAVGLVYTAIYRIWQIGYIDTTSLDGQRLDKSPWWVIVVAMSYFGSRWFGMGAPIAIGLGAVMGLVWYGVVTSPYSSTHLYHDY